MLAWVLPLVAVAAAGGWAASRWVASPADVAARTAPPPPSPILVPVEERVLSSQIITRGTGRFGLPQEVALSPSRLKQAAGLITTLPLRNAPVEEGQVLLTASGRPVHVLHGTTPAYRDMSPGSRGRDVLQLEQALERVGFDPGPIDGNFDAQTSAAVEAWYVAGGWEPFGPTPAQLTRVRTLERELEDAKKAHLAAAARAASAAFAVDASRAAAEQDNRLAQAELATKLVEVRRLTSEGGENPTALESVRAQARYTVQAAQADLDAAIAERALIVLDPRQPKAARAAAEARLELARASLERSRVEGMLAVEAIESQSKLAEVQYELAQAAVKTTRRAGEMKIREALDAQKVANLDATFDRRGRTAAELELARSKLAVQVPVDEIVFIPDLPARVQELMAVVGQEARGPLLTVTNNQLSVDSSLTLDAVPLVTPGMAVSIDEQSLGIKAKGVIETVASTPGTRGVDGYHVYFEVRVLETTGRLENVSVRLSIPTQSTAGPVLAVPLSAVTLAGDGTSRVQVDNNGQLEFVVVEPGMSADGFVQVTPVGGTLTQGQLVVTGYENPAPTGIQ